MTIENEAKLIRRSVEQMRPGRGRKYTPALRHRIMRWLERAGQAGMSDSACSEATGVPAEFRVEGLTLEQAYALLREYE